VSGKQQESSYGDGLETGSFGFSVNVGTQVNFGAHPAFAVSLDAGLHKYVGIYAEGSYVLAYNAQVGEFFGGGGLMVTGNNRYRVIPFGKVGGDYGRVTLFRYRGVNVPAVRYGGGCDFYLTRHFGADMEITGLSTVGRVKTTAAFITFGLFYRK
jgi:hypothetical protein